MRNPVFRSAWGARTLLTACLVAAATPVLANNVLIQGPDAPLRSGEGFTFRALRLGSADSKYGGAVETKHSPGLAAGAPGSGWIWTILEGGGSIDEPGCARHDLRRRHARPKRPAGRRGRSGALRGRLRRGAGAGQAPVRPEGPGLLRDGMEVPLGADYATLAQPRALAMVRSKSGVSLFVAHPNGVAEISCRDAVRDRLSPLTVTAVPPEAAGKPWMLHCDAVTTGPDGKPSIRILYYTVECSRPSGELLNRVQDWGSSKGSFIVPIHGTGAEAVDIVIRCVTDQGVSAGARAWID